MSDVVCEFCGMSYPEYPKGSGKPLGYTYLSLKCRDVRINNAGLKEHIICKDCYDRLEEIR